MSEAENALRQELDETKKRFADWKVRAKASVEKERQRIVDLLEQNENLTKLNSELQSELEQSRDRESQRKSSIEGLRAEIEIAQASVLDSTKRAEELRAELEGQTSMKEVAAVAAQSVTDDYKEKILLLESELEKSREQTMNVQSALDAAHATIEEMKASHCAEISETNLRITANVSNAYALLFERSLVHLSSFVEACGDSVVSKTELYSRSVEGTLGSVVSSLKVSLAEASATLERQKRNMERTMKLASRDQDGAKAENESLRESIKVLEEEISHQRNSVRQRDLAIESLELRLEEANVALGQYESDTVTSANQGHYITELEERVAGMEREFVEREVILHDQHRDEIDRLMAKHEEEMAMVKSALEDQLRDMAYELEAQRSATAAGSVGCAALSVGDGAYEELLAENTRLRREVENATESRRNAQKELAEAKEKLSRLELPNSIGAGGGTHSDTSGMDPAFLRRKIFELEKQVVSLGEQLMRSNQELIEHKAAARERSSSLSMGSSGEHSVSSPLSGGGGGLSTQQQHAYMKAVLVKMLCARTDDVKSSLLPVISTLVKFSNDELKIIYTANPSWIS